jgi:hypothetical protein
MSFAIPPNYPEVEVPTLIIAGEKEPQVMIKSAEDLVNSNKNSQGMLIPQIGHGYSLLLPDEFNRVTESWLKTGRYRQGHFLYNFREEIYELPEYQEESYRDILIPLFFADPKKDERLGVAQIRKRFRI